MEMAREDGLMEVFGRVDEGSTQLPSPLGDDQILLLEEETTIGSHKIGVGGVIKSEGVPKLVAETLAILIVPSIHGAGSKFRGEGG
jgi:hypothetical protein